MKKKSGRGKPSPSHANKLKKSTLSSIPLLVNQAEGDGASNDQRGNFVPESSAGEGHELTSFTEPLLNEENGAVRQCNKKHEETHDEDCEFQVICTECSKGGRVLVCSEKGCPVALHEKCIGSEPILDSTGKFYCPYCWYKLTVAESQELRKKATLAKVALSKFLGQKPVTDAEVKEGDSMSEIQKQNVSIQKATTDCTDHDIQHVGKRVQDDSMHLGEDQRSVSENDKCTMGTEKQKHERTSMVFEDTKDAPIDFDAEGVLLRKRHRKNKVKEETILLSEKKKSFLGARKRLLWTDEEENVLREGVARFTTENQRIPWRKILEFGRHVFDNTRTPVDLKDKWRNLSK